MKIYYHGNSYDYEPSKVGSRDRQVVRPQRPFNLSYRGVTYHVDPNVEPAEVSASQTAYNLRYHGAIYPVLVNSSAQAEATVLTQPTSTTKVRNSSVSQVLTRQDVARVHQANIRQNLQHRLQVARERGDQSLVNLLEVELQEIAPSGHKSV